MQLSTYPNSLQSWILDGGGGTAESYHLETDSGVMLKLFFSDADPALAEKEFASACAAREFGLSTPQALEITEMDGRKGILYERIPEKRSVSRLCADFPERTEEFAALFARECRRMHALPCDPDRFPSRKEELCEAVGRLRMATASEKKRLLHFFQAIPDSTTCLHGDLQSGNLLLSGNTPFWIDLNAFSYGNPMMDLGGAYFFYVFSREKASNQELLHMTSEQTGTFWDAFLREYTGVTDPSKLSAFSDRLKPYALCFIVPWFANAPEGWRLETVAPKILYQFLSDL